MNEMYEMSIVTHYYSVIGVLAVVIGHLIMLIKAKDVSKYARAFNISMPLGMMVLSAVIFTGVVMMTSKHLDFTLANIIMIIIAVIMIILENIRSSSLKDDNKEEKNAFENYKKVAIKILLLETLLILSISAWMLR